MRRAISGSYLGLIPIARRVWLKYAHAKRTVSSSSMPWGFNNKRGSGSKAGVG